MSTHIPAVHKWLEQAVIGLDLCPFAKPVYKTGKVRIIEAPCNDLESVWQKVLDEICYLDTDETPETTTLILLPAMPRFDDYITIVNAIDDILERTPYRGRFQLASFHPDYTFAQTSQSQVENYTNRAPVPIIHIINEADISRAKDFYDKIHDIPDKNKQTMRDLGETKIKALFASFLP